MATRRNLFIVLLLFLSAGTLSAEWREDIAALFAKGKDYQAISAAVLQSFDKLDNADRADAAGILAFCFGRRIDVKDEIKWIVEYFESYGGKDTGFTFLDLISQADVVGWLNTWRGRYPYVQEIAMVKGIGDQTIVPQGILPLVIQITNGALYKFSLEADVLEAGQLEPGFNVIGLDANALYLSPGKRVYTLELKSDNLILKKEISLEVDVTTPPRPPQVSTAPIRQPIQYTLTMYIGGQLVMTSRKLESPLSWKIDVQPNTLPYGFKPDYWINRNQPNPMNTVSIPQALSVLYNLIKNLLTKKSKKPSEVPQIQTTKTLSVGLKQTDINGRQEEIRVTLRLAAKNLPYVLTGS